MVQANFNERNSIACEGSRHLPRPECHDRNTGTRLSGFCAHLIAPYYSYYCTGSHWADVAEQHSFMDDKLHRSQHTVQIIMPTGHVPVSTTKHVDILQGFVLVDLDTS